MIETEDKLINLIKEYEVVIKAAVKKYIGYASTLGIESSDLEQEAIIGLNKAMHKYKEEEKASFKTFASLLIDNQIKDYLKLNDRNNNMMLNEAVSLDEEFNEDDFSLYDLVPDKSYLPLDNVLASELDNEIKKILTVNELKVYELKKEGKSNKTIASILSLDTKAIENTLQRIKNKVKKML